MPRYAHILGILFNRLCRIPICDLHSPILGHLASVLFALPLVEAFEDLGGRMLRGSEWGKLICRETWS